MTLLAVRTWQDRVPDDTRTIGWQVLAWTADYLLQPDGENAGEPWQFTPEQARIVLRWYEVDERGRFIHRRGVVRRLKGWGKDPFLAAIAAVELCGPCRPSGFDADGIPVAVEHTAPWIQVAAVSKDQTRNTMTLFPGMLSPAAVTEYGIDIGKEVIHTRRPGRIEAVTSSPRALEGGRPTMVIMNETHHWIRANDGLEMAAAIRRNLAKARNGGARAMEITNAHNPEEPSVASATYEAWQTSNGKLSGVYYDSLEAPLARQGAKAVRLDTMTDAQVRQSIEAARGDSTWVDVTGLLGEIRDPVNDESTMRRFYFNQIFAGAAETWFAHGVWDKRSTGEAIPDGEDVVLGCDGSRVQDATAIIASTIGERPHIEVVGLWEPAEDAPKDWRVPILDVEEALRTAAKRWQVVEMVFDPALFQHSMAVLADEGHMVVEMPQTSSRMTPATQGFERLVHNDLLTHSGDVNLARHVHNAVVTEDARGRRIRKVNKWSKLRIDLAVAAIMAVDRATRVEVLAPPNIW